MAQLCCRHPYDQPTEDTLTNIKSPSCWSPNRFLAARALSYSAENYRPVSLTCIQCKILEKIVIRQIVNHITINELGSKRPHGFIVGKSVTTNLLEVMNIWTEAIMHNIPVDFLYLDYQKAYPINAYKNK